MRLARTCYDHMAGRLALSIVQSMREEGHLVLADGAALVTEKGRGFICEELGIAMDWSERAGRPLCRTCLDWSERRPHLAGRLGTAMLTRVLELGWVARVPESRALKISRTGEAALVKAFRLPSDWRQGPSGVFQVLAG
jgi:hypothetical protein